MSAADDKIKQAASRIEARNDFDELKGKSVEEVYAEEIRQEIRTKIQLHQKRINQLEALRASIDGGGIPRSLWEFYKETLYKEDN